NQHVQSGLMTSISYSMMVFASVPAIQWFGINGFVSLWLAVEVFQVFMVHSYNARLFSSRKEINLHPTLRLMAMLALVVGGAALLDSFLRSSHYFWQGAAAVFTMSILALVSYFLFGLQAIIREGRGRLAFSWG